MVRLECNICGSKNPAAFARIDHRFISRCNSCGYLFASCFDEEELSKRYKEDYYAAPDDPRINKWIKDNSAVWKGLVKTVRSYKPDAETLLDIGAGTGGFLLEFNKQSPQTKLYAIEHSPEARKNLSGKIPALEFPLETTDDIEKLQGTYDVVTLFQTLEHVYDPLKICKEVYKKLNPAGVCLITVPNRYSYDVLWGGINKGFCFANATHLQFFTKYHLNRMLTSAGFDRVKRVVEFGGSNITGARKILQYMARVFIVSTELRYAAVKY